MTEEESERRETLCLWVVPRRPLAGADRIAICPFIEAPATARDSSPSALAASVVSVSELRLLFFLLLFSVRTPFAHQTGKPELVSGASMS